MILINDNIFIPVEIDILLRNLLLFDPSLVNVR
jgi:hypothetical protein